jgi:hypothetical protein
MTQKLGSALNGATSAFSTTQGAMALFGSENEALEESLLKVQSALAIQQGVDGLTTSYKELGGKTGIATKAQAAFNFVMNLNPILLIVSGITLAIAALLKFTSLLDPVIDGLKNFGDAIGLTDYAGEKRAANEKKRYEAEFKQIQKIKEQKEKAFNNEQKAIERLIAIRSAEGKSTAELTKQKIAGSIAYQKELQKEMQLEIDRREEIIANIDKSSSIERSIALVEGFGLEGLKNANEEALNSIRDSENELKIADINAKKEAVDRNKDFSDKQRELARQIEKERIDAMEDGMEKRLALLKFNEEGELSQIKGKGKKEGELRTAIETRYEKERDKIKEEFRVRRDRDEDVSLEKRPIKRLEIGKSEIDAEAYVQSELLRLQQEADDKRKANTIKRTDEILKATQTFTQVYSSLNGLLNASDNERLKKVEKDSKEEQIIKKRMFNRDKALRISQTIVDTASNIVTSVRNGGGIPTGIPFGIAAGAMGALQIAAIAKAKYDGGETPSTDAGGDVPSGGGASTTPQFNTIGSSGVNQLAQLQQQPVQAYVVSGDVTSAQSLDRNRIQNATL